MKYETLIGSIVVAAAILLGFWLHAIASPPYRLISSGGGFWWVNQRTGEVRMCMAQIGPLEHACTVAWAPGTEKQ